MKLKKRLTAFVLCALWSLAVCSGCSDSGAYRESQEPTKREQTKAATEAAATATKETEEAEFADQDAAYTRIPKLTPGFAADERDAYDFTELALQNLEQIGKGLEARSGEDSAQQDVVALGDWIVEELLRAGYRQDQIEQQYFDYEDYRGRQSGRNLVLSVEGEDPSRQILVGAHYDGDGVGDNGSGVALLLANAVGLAKTKPHYTLRYIFFDAEEVGCEGSKFYSRQMTPEEVRSTLYMVNLDAIAFGDYCNLYGGDPVNIKDERTTQDDRTEAYTFAADTAEMLGFRVLRTEDLDGYFEVHGSGPEIRADTLYTNPWTADHPSPANYSVPSPATLPASDHVGFAERDIAYIYFEATNWFAEGENDEVEATSYTGYVETYDSTLGVHGMFMNTEYDTWTNLNQFFPGRAEEHFRLYSPLLSALLLAK
ncbi:MAG: M28 family peptidase [Oscillospiraceae bacterium]|nr:M28 family peptidase [Oscillospiraceae bacterium]